MSPIRLVSAFGLLLAAGTHTASPASAAPDALATAGLVSALPKLELDLGVVEYATEPGLASAGLRDLPVDAKRGSRGRSLAQILKAPARYGQLLPQPIDDRGIGYRVWF
jgi:hypothetical protein